MAKTADVTAGLKGVKLCTGRTLLYTVRVQGQGSGSRCRFWGYSLGCCCDGRIRLQVWNMNKYSGVVGVFNIQGSSWSRSRRQFIIHDNSPPPLTTVVRPADIPLFSTSQAPDKEPTSGSNGGHSASSSSSSSSSNNGSSSAQQFAVYSNATGDMSVLGLQDEMPVSLAGRPTIKQSLSMHAV